MKAKASITFQRAIYKAIRDPLDRAQTRELGERFRELNAEGKITAVELAKTVASITGTEPRTVYENIVRALAEWLETTSMPIQLAVPQIVEFDKRCGVAALIPIVAGCAAFASSSARPAVEKALANSELWIAGKANMVAIGHGSMRLLTQAKGKRADKWMDGQAVEVTKLLCLTILPRDEETFKPAGVSAAYLAILRAIELRSASQLGPRGGWTVLPETQAIVVKSMRAACVRSVRIYSTLWWD
jgi:hypothetical protein